jgi:hypothetical protein
MKDPKFVNVQGMKAYRGIMGIIYHQQKMEVSG